MAEELLTLRERLLFQATCSICLELFTEPVLTACGHSFCGQCLAGVLGDPPRRSPCPQCRAPVEPGSLRPIRSLGDVAKVVRSLDEVESGPRCPQHGKPLALFCERCAALVCAFCRDGPEHRQHRVRPAEEAARELEEYQCRVLERQSLLDSVIAEIQEKRDQPAVEFLKVRQHHPWAL
uniref:Uncharacterized protein n=1 Tax=Serinus canaria TaxID=9135 RepID=A0A8C9MQP8_SERCA